MLFVTLSFFLMFVFFVLLSFENVSAVQFNTDDFTFSEEDFSYPKILTPTPTPTPAPTSTPTPAPTESTNDCKRWEDSPSFTRYCCEPEKDCNPGFRLTGPCSGGPNVYGIHYDISYDYCAGEERLRMYSQDCVKDVSCSAVVTPVCGNGNLEKGEACDDGNRRNGDGCSSSCVIEPLLECCDDDDNDGYTGASSTSSFLSVCGFDGREKKCKDYNFRGSEKNSCDSNPSVNPGVREICGNNIDENCDGVIEKCAPTCSDRIQNQGETEIDCGGAYCTSCPVAPTCSDGIKNGGETEVDCGTVECGACVIPPYCGDGDIDSGEACDGSNLNSLLCADFSQYNGGPLGCYASGLASECTLDFSGCTNIPVPRNYWADMNGNEITNADFGDAVQMIAEDIGVGTFNIKEGDFFSGDDDIRDVVGLAKGEDLVGVWTIVSEDLDKTDDYGEFYFEIDGRQSGNLEISTDEDDYPISISILGNTECGSYFDEGSASDIVITANDPDSVIIGTVSIYDKVVEFSNGGGVFNQLFDTPGNVQIIVEASAFGGDDKKKLISNIMVLDKENGAYVDASYVAACISSPEYLSDIPGSIVDFDASDTRGIRVTNGVIDELFPGIDEFSWFWTFYPEDFKRNFIDSVDSFAYIFTAEFPIPGVNTAELVVEVD